MIKNLGKFKQWTGEKFGGAKVTLQTEDFQKLEQETENRREGYEHVIQAVEIIQSYLLKRKTSPEDNKTKVMPFEALGSCLYHYGTIFPEDSALGIALINLGQTETRVAALQEALAQDIRTGYLSTLENGLLEYKEYDSLRKKLASRRLDYDSKLNRLNKAKKEKPELEQEMQASRIKYEDTEHDLIQKMAYIQEFENEHRDALLDLVEAQCTYHNQAKELFETIKNNWGQGANSDSCDMMSKIMIRNESAGSHHSIPTEETISSKNRYKTTSIQQQSPASSTDDYNTSTYSSESIIHTTLPTRVPPPTNLPSRQTSTHDFDKHRKALFDFTGQNADEISFKTGDVIAVIDEIDKGWWLGEAHSKRGIFPVNYTEEYDLHSQPLPPLPPTNEPPITLPPQSDTPNNLPIETLESSVIQNTRRPPISSSPIPGTRGSLSRKRSTAIRAPPPPPAARVNSIELSPSIKSTLIHDTPPHFVHEEPSSYIKSTSSSLHSREELPASRSSSPPPPSRLTEDHHSHNTEPIPQAKEDPCSECDCHSFVENLFKKGYCNKCFHKH